MMGYQYPGGNTDISATSSALGILMTTPVGLYLSDEGKNTLIEEILADPNFPALVEVVEQMMIVESPLLDTTNIALIDALQDMEESVFMSPPPPGPNLPVNMFRAGRNIVFNNKGVSFGTVVSMYQDNEKINEAYVKGVTVVPGSPIDIWAGYGEVSEGNIVEYPFEMQGDGEFTFKFRTGFPGRGDGSPEHDIAFWDNIIDFSYGLIGTFLPVPNFECFNAAKASLASVLMSTHSINSNSNVGIGSILFAVTDATMGLINSLEECKKIGEKNYFTKVARLFAVAAKAFSFAGNGANTFFFAKDWEKYDAVIDTCFMVEGNTIEPGCLSCTDKPEGQWLVERYGVVDCDYTEDNFLYVANSSTGYICQGASYCHRDVLTFTDDAMSNYSVTVEIDQNGYEYTSTSNDVFAITYLSENSFRLCAAGDCNVYTFSFDDTCNELTLLAPVEYGYGTGCNQIIVAYKQ